MVNIILSKRGETTTQTVGEKWVYNFINQQDIKTQFSRRYNHPRAKCESPKDHPRWFNRVEIAMMLDPLTYQSVS
jgi:hypothetical protein